jgi:hypothetical protein
MQDYEAGSSEFTAAFFAATRCRWCGLEIPSLTPRMALHVEAADWTWHDWLLIMAFSFSA